MKTLPAVAGSLVGLLAVLSLPGPEPPVAPAPARGHGFAWNQDAFWRSLEKTYGDARAVGCRAADPVAGRELSALGSTADRLLGTPLDPVAAVLDSVERRLFTLAPLVAACPRHLGDYVRLSGRLREAIKWQSRRWDVAGDAARARLYRSLYGLRGAVEEVMLHHPDSVTALLDGCHEPSATPPTTVHGVEIHSGDILVSRGCYPTSALIARGNDYPGNFSHIALVHVDSVSHVASAIEAHIERGVAVSTADEYMGDKKLRIMVLRLRADLPQLARDPQLPHRAAALALERARSGRIGYDFEMDYTDASRLFCSEVASSVYRELGVTLWTGLSTISGAGLRRWLASFGCATSRRRNRPIWNTIPSWSWWRNGATPRRSGRITSTTRSSTRCSRAPRRGTCSPMPGTACRSPGWPRRTAGSSGASAHRARSQRGCPPGPPSGTAPSPTARARSPPESRKRRRV